MAGGRSYTYELLEELGDDHQLGCKCCRFEKGIDLPIPRKLSIDETTQCARELSASIFKHWTKLNAIIKRFEGTIQKRWMKKNQKQRRDLLLKAWPKISITHRPDFENFRNLKKQASRSRTCHSEAFLWPYINLEDLQQRHLLLLFLNSRGRNLPETFRMSDLRNAHLGHDLIPHLDFTDLAFMSNKKREAFFEEYDVQDHCMLFEKKSSPLGYGRVIDRKTLRMTTSRFRCLSRCAEGLLVLEIQECTYRFLYNCAMLILHDMQPNLFLLAPHQPEPVMPRGDDKQWPSLSNYALAAPYCVPQQLDLDRMKTLVSARRSLAEDHVWMMREDPAYFTECLRDWNEHSSPKGEKPNRCPCVNCWNDVASRVIGHAFVSLVGWSEIHDKIQAMPSIREQIHRASETKMRLHPLDEANWSVLLELLLSFTEVPLGNLKTGIPASPRLRNHYYWSGDHDDGHWRQESRASEAERRVGELFTALQFPKGHSRHGIIQEIQYMEETDTEASQYLDSWLMGHFSDLALMSELTQSVDGLAPWFDRCKAYRNMAIAGHSPLHVVHDLVGDLRAGIYSACEASELLWDPLNMKTQFDYPVDKRRNKANVEQMVKAEQNLDTFWWSLEIAVSDDVGLDLTEILDEQTSPPRELYRTPPWKDPIQLPSPQATPQRSEPLAEIDTNLQRSPTFTESPTSKSFDVTPPKEKVKTRGKPTAPDPRRAPLPTANETKQPPVEKVKIPKKAYKVFSALLPSSANVVQQRGEIAWDELVWAFHNIGLEPEKLYGSVWVFKPLPKEQQGPGKVKLDRSIQFHEPKEVRRGAKIPRPMVRTFGRRLKHAFGWGDAAEIFECE